jgi:hypothetical protein
MKTLTEEFTKARRAGVPLVSINSFDPEATMVSLQKSSNGDSPPIIQWDIIHGWRARNSPGTHAIAEAVNKSGAMDVDNTINPVESLNIAKGLPEKSILFILNPRFYMDRGEFIQALWNLRDVFKENQRTCILIGNPVKLPTELINDVLILDEPLPTEIELRDIVNDLLSNNNLTEKKENIEKSIDALRGTSAFMAEQAIAVNLSKKGIDIEGLWERKRQLISETPGLKVYYGKEKFSNIGGCDQVKKFFSRVISGKEPPRVIVFIDEGEKMFSGQQDTSGISQDFLGTTLSYMEDNECDGAIFVGPPGAAKSAMAKAAGNEAEIPTIILDLGGMKGSLVGESETNLRNALKIITAVGGGKTYFVMTCNRIAILPPELRRRFTSGIFFFDLPTYEERQNIWEIYKNKYRLKITQDSIPITFDEGWTGAEIRNCCRMAYRQNLTLTEASEFIVPVSKSSAEQIKQLRIQASGAFLSANHKGLYRYEEKDSPNVSIDKQKARKVSM